MLWKLECYVNGKELKQLMTKGEETSKAWFPLLQLNKSMSLFSRSLFLLNALVKSNSSTKVTHS